MKMHILNTVAVVGLLAFMAVTFGSFKTTQAAAVASSALIVSSKANINSFASLTCKCRCLWEYYDASQKACLCLHGELKGLKPINGKCNCPAGYFYSNYWKQCVPNCKKPLGYSWKYDACVCTSGDLVGHIPHGSLKEPLCKCPVGYIPNAAHTKCVKLEIVVRLCPAGWYWSRWYKKCVPKCNWYWEYYDADNGVCKCKRGELAGHLPFGDGYSRKCYCPKGWSFNHKTNSCEKDKDFTIDWCPCGWFYSKYYKQCIPKCRLGWETYSKELGTCVCKKGDLAGYFPFGGPISRRCICPKGYHFDWKAKTCVRDCCDFICTFEHNPVCDQHGKTYSNLCVFKKAQCKDESLRLAPCKKNESCLNRICPLYYDPICDQFGRRFSNKCLFETADCLSQIDLKPTKCFDSILDFLGDNYLAIIRRPEIPEIGESDEEHIDENEDDNEHYDDVHEDDPDALVKNEDKQCEGRTPIPDNKTPGVDDEVPEKPEPKFKVVGFKLVDAHSNKDYSNLTKGNLIDLTAVPKWNVVAITEPKNVGSVRFYLGSVLKQQENAYPYAMCSDSGGNYKPCSWKEGSYSVEAKPYSQANGAGTLGGTKTINFKITGSTFEVVDL
eukprot:Nk52_evm12s2474 gene=Nk52_evmTU12s2474